MFGNPAPTIDVVVGDPSLTVNAGDLMARDAASVIGVGCLVVRGVAPQPMLEVQ